MDTIYQANFPKVNINRIDKKETGNFTQVFNHIIDSKVAGEVNLPKLKPTPARLLENILKTPDNWNFSITDMAQRVYVGTGALRTAMKQLVFTGYLKIIRYMDEATGRFLGTVYFVSEKAEFVNENKILEDKKNICHYLKVTAESFINRIFLPLYKKPNEVEGNKPKAHEENPYTSNTDSTNIDLIKIDLKNTTSYVEKFSEPKEINDDVFFKNFEIKNEFIENQQGNISDSTNNLNIEEFNLNIDLPSDCPPKAIPGAMQAIGNFVKGIFPGQDKQSAKKEFKELLELFKKADYNGKNINFNEYQAKKLLNEYDHGMIRNEIKWLPYRDVKSNPAGVLNDSIKAGGYGQPTGYIEKEKNQEDTKKYGKVFEIWEGKERKVISEDTAKTMLTHYIMKDYKAGITTSFVEKLRKTFQIIDIHDCFKITDEILFSELKALTD